MSEPVQLSERVYYLPGGVNTTIIKTPASGAILIDTGQDKTYGRNLRKACERLALSPVAIINTHSHADHYGGNDYLLRQFDIPVYAPTFEAGIIQNPYLEPVYLFNGAKPPAELMNKWLLAKPSRVDHVLTAGRLELHGVTLDLIDTSGHAHTQLSVLVDDILLAADAVFGAAVLDKYPLPFGQDIRQQLTSVSKLDGLDARLILPGHGDPSEDIQALLAKNLSALQTAAQTVLNACDGKLDDVLQATCQRLDIAMGDLPRYYLNRCVVSAYLSYLRDEGQVEATLQENRLRWVKLS